MRSWVSAPLGSERSEVTPSQQFPDGIYAGQLMLTWMRVIGRWPFFVLNANKLQVMQMSLLLSSFKVGLHLLKAGESSFAKM